MSFHFLTGEDDYKSLTGLINRNDGKFVSANQAKFWLNRVKKQVEAEAGGDFDPWAIADFYKIDIPYGAYAYTSQVVAHFGVRTNIYFDYIFVIDALGVIAKHKMTKKPKVEFIADRPFVSFKDAIAAGDIELARLNKIKVDALAKEGIAIPNGDRVEVAGDIIKIRFQPDQFGDRHVMTVQLNGYKTYGTVPKAMHKLADKHGLEVGDMVGAEISFTATITPSHRDPLFTFFKRPAKFEMDDNFLALAILQKDF